MSLEHPPSPPETGFVNTGRPFPGPFVTTKVVDWSFATATSSMGGQEHLTPEPAAEQI